MRHFFLALVICGVSAAGAQAPNSYASHQQMAHTAEQDAKDLANAATEYKLAKHAYAHFSHGMAKRVYVAATDRYAMLSMTGSALPRQVKYKQALRLYREVLKVDPKNHEAKNNSDLIISIYKQLHKPIPN